MDNKPQIPTLKDSQQQQKKENKPLLKIKGLSGGGQSLIERLKQFKKKDLAFILAGLGVLFMAPLAEHFMMSPEDGDGKFKDGFNKRDGVFGNGGSPWENGVTGMAPGGVIGGGSDVITPLNVRDPSALVMGPGATQQAPAGAPQPPVTAPPVKEDSKWNDAIAAGKAAASSAGRRAGLPVPKVPLSAGGLRGLGAVSGGSGSNFSLSAPSAGNVPNKPGAAKSGLNNVKGSIKGVARGPGSGGNAGALEQLKKNAQGAANDFNRAGGAGAGLESAYNRDMGSGRDGAGAGQGGASGDKDTAGSSNKDSKSPGESLEFLRLKQEQEKAIDLKWKLKEKQAMLWPNLKEKMLEEAVMTPFKAITKGIADTIGEWGSSASPTLICSKYENGQLVDAKSGVAPCAGKGEDKGLCSMGGILYNNGTEVRGYQCTKSAGDKGAPPSGPAARDMAPGNKESGAKTDPADRRNPPQEFPQSAAGNNCVTLDRSLDRTDVPAGAKADSSSAWMPPFQGARASAGTVAQVEQELTGNGGNAMKCGTSSNAVPITKQLSDSRNKLLAAMAKIKELSRVDGQVQETALGGKDGGLIDKGIKDLSAQVDQAAAGKTLDASKPDVAAMQLSTQKPVTGALNQADEIMGSPEFNNGLVEADNQIRSAQQQLGALKAKLEGVEKSDGMTSKIKDRDYQKWYGGRLDEVRGSISKDVASFKGTVADFQSDAGVQAKVLADMRMNLQKGDFAALRQATKDSVMASGEINGKKTNPKFFQEDVAGFVKTANEKLKDPKPSLEAVKAELKGKLTNEVAESGKGVHTAIKNTQAVAVTKRLTDYYQALGVPDRADAAAPAASNSPSAPTVTTSAESSIGPEGEPENPD